MTEPFPLVTPNPGFAANATLQTLLEDKIKKAKSAKAFAHMSLALVDLTRAGTVDKPGKIDYAGWNDIKEQRIFSLAKAGTMFAAYRLRERVRLAGKALSAKTADEVFAQIKADWNTKIVSRVPEIRRDFPELAKIFKVTGTSGSWNFDFTDSGHSWDNLDILHGKHGISTAQAESMGFLDRIKLMVAHSDNAAAGSCVRHLGYQYLNGALVAEGFQDKGPNKTGLWVASDYVGIRNAGYVPPMPPAPISDLTQGGTAKSVAALLTLLQTENLVDAESSKSMKKIMLFGRGTRSFWDEGLSAAGRAPTQVLRKIGMGTNNSEGGIITRTSGSKILRYAAVALNALTIPAIQDVIVVLDDCIVEINA